MAEPKYHKVEWKIENFSCWCDVVHGKFIDSSPFFFSSFEKAQLFPRGVSGRDDHMEVRFRNVKTNFTCELSFVNFEGSIIHSQQVVESTSVGETAFNVIGPKFDEVIDNIRKVDRKNEINLNFCMRKNRSCEQLMCSTLNVLKVSLKIDPKIIGMGRSNFGQVLSFIPFTSDKNDTGLYLKMVTQCDNVFLVMKPQKNQEAVLAHSCTTMVNNDGAIVKCEENRHVFIDEEGWKFSESLKKTELEENGSTILISIKVATGEVLKSYNHFNFWKEVSVIPDNPLFSEPKSIAGQAPYSDHPVDSVTELAKELMCLYQDHDYSDLELKCDNVSFPVHRNILSARSPVFKSMLSCDMQEAATGCVDIVDMTPSTLALFLAFLYAGSVEGMQDESALNLYYAADKYQVPSLKKKCVDYLSANVSLSNVCDILTLADKHKDEYLIAVSHNYILDNNSEVMESEEWKRFMESESLLALQTLTYFAHKKYFVKKILI